MNFPKKRSEFRIWSDTRNKQVQDYISKRKTSYPPIGEQLDSLWHDIDNGILPGKEGKFYQSIAEVKKLVKSPDWSIEEYINYDFSQEKFIEDMD